VLEKGVKMVENGNAERLLGEDGKRLGCRKNRRLLISTKLTMISVDWEPFFRLSMTKSFELLISSRGGRHSIDVGGALEMR
jgi:hypothetical protein